MGRLVRKIKNFFKEWRGNTRKKILDDDDDIILIISIDSIEIR